jgi:hypothetical protein
MSWQLYVGSAETVLESGNVPSSEEIISLIKKVNPTSLPLSETDREHGYLVKNRLQNLLLENYGEVFRLTPHPYSQDIVLIKHNSLPSIDACHADINALSAKALDTVDSGSPHCAEAPKRTEAKGKPVKASAGSDPKEVLRNAELLLEQYEYPQAEELLASIRISDSNELPTLVKAAGVLVREMGAYQRAIELLLAQPRQVLKDRAVRELLAVTYYGNGMITEARALFDTTPAADLAKEALYAYADISFKDGNLSRAYYLLKLSEQKEGFVTAHASLRKEIEAAMLSEAEPFFQQGREAFAAEDLPRAECLLQKAISLYPNFQKARQLAGEIDARKTASEVATLWERLASSESAAARLDLLAQLLERDKASSGKVRELIDFERGRQKREAVQQRLHDLQPSVDRQEWDKCFDIIFWLSREGDAEGYRRGCQFAPYLSVLYQNKRLQRLPDQEAKELWLRFITLQSLVEQGRTEGCWETFQDLKRYFHSYPPFREQYDKIFAHEQAKAKEEIIRFLALLEELSEQEGDNLAEARSLVAAIRKRYPLLTAEETADCDYVANAIVHRIEMVMSDEGSILDYREALILGNLAKAAQLKELNPWPEELIKIAEEQVAKDFAIVAEPVTLVVSPDLAVDLTTERLPNGLTYLCSSPCHLLFREDEQTILVINLRRMTATKLRSPNFEDVAVLDILPDKDLFLFINKGNKVFRAVLSETESRFTATFNLNEHFDYGEEASFAALFMSSGKDNVYYAVIHDINGLRCVKQNVGLVSSVERSFELAGEHRDTFRLSYQPDRFVIVTDSTTTVLECNLELSRGCSQVGRDQSLSCLGINRYRSHIYALGDGVVNVLNTRLRAVKQYLKAASVAYMQLLSPANICIEKSIALMNISGVGIFYNMETNKFSQKFWMNRLLSTETPSRWYYWELDAIKPAVVLRDVTDEVESMLEWQVLLSAVEEDEEVIADFASKLNDVAYFSIAKPAGQPPVLDGTPS